MKQYTAWLKSKRWVSEVNGWRVAYKVLWIDTESNVPKRQVFSGPGTDGALKYEYHGYDVMTAQEFRNLAKQGIKKI